MMIITESGPVKRGQNYDWTRVVQTDDGTRYRLTQHWDTSYPHQSRIVSEVWRESGWTQVYVHQPTDFETRPRATNNNLVGDYRAALDAFEKMLAVAVDIDKGVAE